MVTARGAGAPVIQVEPNPYRRRMAREMGAYMTVDPLAEDVVKVVAEATGNEGATLVVECSGSDGASAAAIHCAAPLGRILLIGHSAGRKVPVELGEVVLKGIRVIGNNGNPYMFPPTMTFLAQHLVDVTPLITHRFALDDLQDAFDLCIQGDCGKVLIETS
jgi:L-iditol 2-dehydrogenase